METQYNSNQELITQSKSQIFNILASEISGDPNWQTIWDIISKSFSELAEESENISLEDISKCRAIVLNLAEQKLLGHINWKIIRKNLLRVFGNRGLDGILYENNGKDNGNG